MAERLFVDSSVIVAVLRREPDWRVLADRLKAADARFTSPVAIVEVVMRLSSVFKLAPSLVEKKVRQFLIESGIEIMPVDDSIATTAIGAFERYGKGRHPARLNFGDCFSYACARAAKLTMLYKGDDFAKTDLA